MPTSDAAFLHRLLDVVTDDIVPLTESAVQDGNKVFGAALLRKSDLSLVLAETNNEMENPLWHGEIHCLKRFYEMPATSRPAPPEMIFLSTHEPCSLCLSAITWAGFDNFHYFFSHEDSRDCFAIPHDLNILREVFDVQPGGYRKENAYWTAQGIRPAIDELPDEEKSRLEEKARTVEAIYDRLSAQYQAGKDGNAIPLR